MSNAAESTKSSIVGEGQSAVGSSGGGSSGTGVISIGEPGSSGAAAEGKTASTVSDDDDGSKSSGPSDTYSLTVGMIYVFNMILGTGALAMPAVFAQAGWLLGIVVITTLCFVAFVQVTFLIEAMANANFIFRIDSIKIEQQQQQQQQKQQQTQQQLQQQQQPVLKQHEALIDQSIILNTSPDTISGNSQTQTTTITTTKLSPSTTRSVTSPTGNDNNKMVVWKSPTGNLDLAATPSTDNLSKLLANVGSANANAHRMKHFFEIDEKFEIGRMTDLFLPAWQSKLFFVSIIMYMFGDLIIYNTMMAKSLRELTCTAKFNCTDPDRESGPCWGSSGPSRTGAYRIYLAVLLAILLPLTYLRLTKTKAIQIATIVLRWLAFFAMVGIAIRIFSRHDPATIAARRPIADLTGFPRMFGICVYAFMCHHSVPSMITPIDNKRYLLRGLTIDFCLVIFCYLLITLTGIFAFEQIEDVYTLNFVQNSCKIPENAEDDATRNDANVPGLNIFLPSYPVFTIFSSYTVIALTLINNLVVILNYWISVDQTVWLKYSLPLIAIIPPMIVSLFTDDVSLIVSYVGSYTGSLIQYVFPSLLAYYSRKAVRQQYISAYLALDTDHHHHHHPQPHYLSSKTTTTTATTKTTLNSKVEIGSEKDCTEIEKNLKQQTGKMATAKMLNNNNNNIDNNKEGDREKKLFLTGKDDEDENIQKQIYLTANSHVSPFQNNFWLYATAVWWIFALLLVTMDHIVRQVNTGRDTSSSNNNSSKS